jgi:hypothetical protein
MKNGCLEKDGRGEKNGGNPSKKAVRTSRTADEKAKP